MKQLMHIGRNISKLRSFRGIKQDDMASRLKMTQQNYSHIENSETVSKQTLQDIAEILGYEVGFIEQLPDAPYVYSSNQSGGNVINYNFNPIEKIVELYDALLKSEREKIEMLKKMLDKK